MRDDNGGEPVDGTQEPRDSLAPVIPLFGHSSPSVQDAATIRPPETTRSAERVPEAPVSAGPDWHATWLAEAPVVAEVAGEEHADAADVALEQAEKALLKKLRARSLSVREARAVLAESDVAAEAADTLIEVFLSRGYLDDAALADQVVYTSAERKGQGRQAIARALAKRGISREIADAALMVLPDDDAERALEFARSKARSMSSLDRDTAVRRLTGQLARRGYPGGVALAAARRALDESGATTGVRFR